jgi:molybdate transport system substrate-binding protein
VDPQSPAQPKTPDAAFFRRRGAYAAFSLAFLAAAAMLFSVLTAAPASAREAASPVVAAAADLRFALPEIVDLFRRRTGREVRLSFGSSGNFARQILQAGKGGPFELFLSADEGYVRRLADAGLTDGEGRLYALGRVALFIPHGSPLLPDAGLRDLAKALDEGRLRRFAIANPEHAPYGRAAREALRRAGLWEGIGDHLVLGENASQATRFAASGAAEGGIVPYSLAISPAVSERGAFVLLPGEWHSPLRQRMVLLKGAGETARRFYAFLQTPHARAVLIRHGFASPAASG